MVKKTGLLWSSAANTRSVSFFKATLEPIPFPGPVKNETGAIQPFNSCNASFAGCMRIQSRSFTCITCKCRRNFGLQLFSSSYDPWGIHETCAWLFFQGSSIPYDISLPYNRIFPLVPIGQYVLRSSGSILFTIQEYVFTGLHSMCRY